MKYNPDNPFFQFMNTLAAFIGLNVVFLITCIPVVTIGPSLYALYKVAMQEARKEHGYIFSAYFRAFKESFFSSAGMFLIQLGLAFVFLFNVVFWGSLNTVIGNVFLFLITFLVVALVLSMIYSYPLAVRFENTIRQTLKNAFCIAVTTPGATIAMIALRAVCIAACVFIPQAKIFMVLLGFSFIAFCDSYLLIRVFEKYEVSEA